MEKTLQLLGEKIKFLRKKQNLTQIALSEGICTQPYLSHIEKGQTSPSAYVLNKLANRLGVDPNYLLKTEENEKYIQEMMELIREATTKRDYILVEDILKNEQMIFFKNEQLKQFYYWYKGITVFYNKNDIHKSIKYIDYAIDLEGNSPFFSNAKLEIMISKANILMDCKLYKDAEELYKIITA